MTLFGWVLVGALVIAALGIVMLRVADQVSKSTNYDAAQSAVIAELVGYGFIAAAIVVAILDGVAWTIVHMLRGA